MTKEKKYYLIIFLTAVPLIIFGYFYKWKVGTVSGDDLYLMHDYGQLKTFGEKINMPVSSGGRYRPVSGFFYGLVIECFKRNLLGYYLFNVVVQAIITFIFARIVNLFLQSQWLSLFVSLLVGLSRFSFYNITQLLNGGPLEGMAMVFFLLFLYYLIKIMVGQQQLKSRIVQRFLLAILFANLCMYTHERYFVVFIYLVFFLLFYPGLKVKLQGQRYFLLFITLASVGLNAAIKKYMYGLPFLTGTAGTNVSLSLSSVLTFFTDAMLSIFQFNSGPDHTAGFRFTSLSWSEAGIVLIVVATILFLFRLYIQQSVKVIAHYYFAKIVEKSALKPRPDVAYLPVFIFLIPLFLLLLVPAVVTVRLDQRWLQASFCIFIMLIAIAFKNLHTIGPQAKIGYASIFIILFLLIDFNYLNKGANNFFWKMAEQSSFVFKDAMKNNVIRPATKNLYIFEKPRDVNGENGLVWALGSNYVFTYYQGSDTKIYFIDSVYERSFIPAQDSLRHFNKATDQIIHLGRDVITDITGEYLKDSLKSFNAK